jgi:hypothetical protein
MKRLILILLVISSWLIPKPVFAAIDTLTVNSTYTVSNELLGVSRTDGYTGGASDYTNLNSDDADTTYFHAENPYGYWYADFTYNMSNFASSYYTINSVTVYVKARENGGYGQSIYPMVRINGASYYGSNTSLTNTYTIYSKTWSVNPSTGTNWTASEINSAMFGYKGYSTGTSDQLRVTYMYIAVDYSPPTVPSLTTTAVTSNSVTSSTLNGTITSNNGSGITNYAFVWGATSVPVNPGNVAPAAAGYGANW